MDDYLLETYKHNNLTIKIFTDVDNQDGPDTWGNYEIVQFRDDDYTTYGDLDDYLTENGYLRPEIRAKLQAGKMFTIDYRSYSSTDGGYYHLDGGIPKEGSLDSRDINGFIVFEDAYIKGTKYDERRKYAEQDLKTYTEWANGEVYGWVVETPAGDHLDSCWGYIGDSDYAKKEAEACAEAVRPASYAKNAGELHR